MLAVSGLRRLEMSERISAILPSDLCLHAVGQGALAIECRTNDEVVQDLIEQLNHRDTALRFVDIIIVMMMIVMMTIIKIIMFFWQVCGGAMFHESLRGRL